MVMGGIKHCREGRSRGSLFYKAEGVMILVDYKLKNSLQV